MKDTVFFRQAELLLRILPLVHREEVFALKGGTAINFFVRDLPRISVDIDLTYLPVNERDFEPGLKGYFQGDYEENSGNANRFQKHPWHQYIKGNGRQP